VDDAYLKESMLAPQAKIVAGFQPVMPTFQGVLSDREVVAIIEYIKTLK
jgi:cytochrome c oxidase subunit 2